MSACRAYSSVAVSGRSKACREPPRPASISLASCHPARRSGGRRDVKPAIRRASGTGRPASSRSAVNRANRAMAVERPNTEPNRLLPHSRHDAGRIRRALNAASVTIANAISMNGQFSVTASENFTRTAVTLGSASPKSSNISLNMGTIKKLRATRTAAARSRMAVGIGERDAPLAPQLVGAKRFGEEFVQHPRGVARRGGGAQQRNPVLRQLGQRRGGDAGIAAFQDAAHAEQLLALVAGGQLSGKCPQRRDDRLALTDDVFEVRLEGFLFDGGVDRQWLTPRHSAAAKHARRLVGASLGRGEADRLHRQARTPRAGRWPAARPRRRRGRRRFAVRRSERGSETWAYEFQPRALPGDLINHGPGCCTAMPASSSVMGTNKASP